MNPEVFYKFDLQKVINIEEGVEKLVIEDFTDVQLPTCVCQSCRGINRHISGTCYLCLEENKIFDLNNSIDGVLVEDKYQHLVKYVDCFYVRIGYFKVSAVFDDFFEYAKHYIHFSTYTIDKFMLGKIEDTLKRGVQVAGVVGLSHDFSSEIKELNEKYQGKCYIIPWQCKYGNKYSLPHQKITIFDGVVCFIGSMNLSKAGMKKLELSPPFEFVYPVTDMDSIVSINNEYLSPLFVPDMADSIAIQFIGDR